MSATTPHIDVRDLTMAYGTNVVMRELNFQVSRGEIFVIMGGSGCGKSTLLRHMIGLLQPASGEIFYNGKTFTKATAAEHQRMLRTFGVLYQSGALWSSLTLAENIATPLEEFTDLKRNEIADIVSYKLSLVGLGGFEEYYPSEISGGMKKRAALARAMALDPEILFFDEPSAGLDPITSRRLDELILEISRSMNTTVVLVTHELPSLLGIGDNSIFLDVTTKRQGPIGNPSFLKDHSTNPNVRKFLNRGESPSPTTQATPGP
ncbi:ABC transporter ATP-binding protein [Sulfuriroseicoccus oceanibius]|uniref:ATP-binding cassette domain-containing protein n=1 Tax=Sulfuriroseicoccus oceanibius TaxID=2707525 RepID=A0A6B3L5A2_9BACT|nr:ATP-binding cassette domain-containing protein [Sulfuriroseicoccus oceanibius]QQL44521.1 ATP-binding cassette domain-containing protein [Sulfuriroseicoccus oceanibius]